MEVIVEQRLAAVDVLAVVFLAQRQDAQVHDNQGSLPHAFRVLGERLSKPGVGLGGVVECVQEHLPVRIAQSQGLMLQDDGIGCVQGSTQDKLG